MQQAFPLFDVNKSVRVTQINPEVLNVIRASAKSRASPAGVGVVRQLPYMITITSTTC